MTRFAVQLLLLIALAAATENPGRVSLSSFRSVAILDEGRVKPLESFARSRLLQFSSRETLGGKPAIAWLARVFFDPEGAADEKIFRIETPQVAQALGIPAAASFRYSPRELSGAFPALQDFARRASRTEERERGPFERAILRLHLNVNRYLEMQGALQFATPSAALAISDPQVRSRMGLPSRRTACSWLELRDLSTNLIQELGRADVSTEVVIAAQGMRQMAEGFASFALPILASKTASRTAWLSPWSVLNAGGSDPSLESRLHALARMRESWAQSDEGAFQREVDAFRAENRRICAESGEHPLLRLEVFYHIVAPFSRARILYLVAFLGLMASWLPRAPGALWLLRASRVSIGLALLLHVAGIAARMAISGRPPVTHLYETFLFASAVIVALSLFLDRRRGSRLGLLVASIAGAGFLFLAERFSAEGDTLRVLVAVLDSNFWLSTHVVSVTIGYAGVVLSGILGHAWMVQAIRRPLDRRDADETLRLVYGTQAFGLLFTFTGTILGGIWADQSWGRFWGWDPKENGALLIVLWSALLFHARLVGWIRDAGFAAGSMAGIMVVAFAWFGVNYLGVGLHAYGFSDGARGALYAYWILQTLVIVAALRIAHGRLKQNSRGPA